MDDSDGRIGISDPVATGRNISTHRNVTRTAIGPGAALWYRWCVSAPVIANLTDLTDRALLLLILERLQHMSITADNTKAAVDALTVKTDALLAAFATVQASNTALQANLATLTAQIAALQAQIASGDPSPADVAELQATVAEAQAESAKIDAALAPVTPPETAVAAPSKT